MGQWVVGWGFKHIRMYTDLERLHDELVPVVGKVHMELVDGWQDGEKGAKLAMILEACINQGMGRELERMWRSQFEKRPAPQSSLEL